MSKNTVINYGWQSSAGPESCSYITPEILSVLSRLNVKRVLDLGSGNGKLCSEIAQQGYDAAGVEYDRQGVNISQSNYPDIPFYNFGVQDSPQQLLENEKPFDAVVSTEVIEHLFSPHQLPNYASGVLKQGGYLIITTPYHGYLKNLALSVFNQWDKHHSPLWHGGHIKFWSRHSLTRLLETNGFTVSGFSGVGRLPYLWKSMVLIARKAP